MTARRRIKIGDILEIRTPAGFAYAQYVNRHLRPPKYGDLMRILPGVFARPLTDFSDIVVASGSYCCFWWPSRDVANGSVSIVGNVAVPMEHRRMPMFKWGISSLRDGRVRKWNLWNPK